ncbi:MULTISPECIES: 1,2-phenylacetyl-CoA epoxidase subunit PaaE [unclassified Nocardioides]|uniref:1,2-phenylacetyl-CoA epoxidase subunit PaaE n=1 Tax=unclassified Nocardioides TaxID=2615069 RepID=UPI00070135A4|nr:MULTISPECIES: 1,2-phenylacetyl-CoA epoxidase subunit PaaE [unclassified Nocardioides]KQY63887.1 phenylacetic acid degradation protein [Nocardioides sp. Root140]KQZ69804.1 phenylacetic acid degradation protein [Nocardioides sp. Root151]KRF15901.1 phenylacetic acid degradation protein [Nocardioides sp. Soil796]
MPAHASFHPLKVAALEPLTDDSVSLTFEVPDELRDAYTWLPGQHLTINCEDGVRRSYSICTSPSTGTLKVGIKRLADGAFSGAVLDRLQVGDTLEVMTPAGRFTPAGSDEPRTYAAIAAGSGITPVLSIVTALLESEPGAAVTLVYANRDHRSVMFLDEIHDLKDRFLTRFRVVHVLSREEQEVELLSGRLDADRLHRLLDRVVPAKEVDEWFLCGPHAMVTELRDELARAGAETVHTELFHADPVPRSRAAEESSGTGETSRVTVRLDGRSSTFDLAGGGVPVLEAALKVRSDAPFACRGGVCGTCRAKVVTGTVTMDTNWALEQDEVDRGYVLTCQSHPTSPELVLDYDA